MTREEAIQEIKASSPARFLTAARKKGFICPSCGNGSGRDGDGIVRNPRTGLYKCFKCDAGGDIIDLIGLAYNLDNFNDKFDKAVEIYGLSVEKYGSGNGSRVKQDSPSIIREVAKPQNRTDIAEYYKRCHENVGKTSYFTDRGLSSETIEKFNLGYDAEFTDGKKLKYAMKAAILPVTDDFFIARNVDIVPGGDGFRYYNHGSVTLFNSPVLSTEKEKPVFIVEGMLDALSIIDQGGQAIGLCSAVNYKILVSLLDKTVPAKPLVLLFDPDDAGRENEKRLAAELDRLKIPYLTAGDVLGKFHDANDRLVKDREGLRQAIAETYRKADALPAPADVARAEYMATSAGNAVEGFIGSILSKLDRPRLSTGFKSIDDAFDGGLNAGLYIIGAISSLGKTTLSLQIADNLAKQGRDVLFFSLEQSRHDLMSKSVSRETFLHCRRNGISENRAKSNLGVSDGRRWAGYTTEERNILNAAFDTYRIFAKHVFIYEGVGNISVSEIRDRLKHHISITGNTPVIFIDYLQILKAAEGDERATDKQVVDHNVTALKQLSRDFEIPIVAVSSLNRENYRNKINMAAFKESGAIEYGSDVLIGLQFTGAGSDSFDVDKAKEDPIRKIDFCVLKNRNGRTPAKGIPLEYYPVFNCFLGDENDKGLVPIETEDVPVSFK